MFGIFMKQAINQALNKLIGHHLVNSRRSSLFRFLDSAWVRSVGIQTVIDVGANIGQFSSEARSAFPQAKIYAFEPIAESAEILSSAFKNDINFTVFQFGLGTTDEIVDFNLNEFTPTSSLLRPTEMQRRIYPETGCTRSVKIEVKRLDSTMKLSALDKNILLKIDVQGYEDRVIVGAGEVLSEIALIIAECSFMEFYQGQPLFHDICNLLYRKGFEFRGVVDQLNSGKQGEPTQIDAVFVNAHKDLP
jgi:FkbM family methyltransferase